MSGTCVFGCPNLGVTQHRFPDPNKNLTAFNAWVSLLKEDLNGMTNDEIYNNLKVCDIHFPVHCKKRNKCLTVIAVPSLCLKKKHHNRHNTMNECYIKPLEKPHENENPSSHKIYTRVSSDLFINSLDCLDNVESKWEIAEDQFTDMINILNSGLKITDPIYPDSQFEEVLNISFESVDLNDECDTTCMELDPTKPLLPNLVFGEEYSTMTPDRKCLTEIIPALDHTYSVANVESQPVSVFKRRMINKVKKLRMELHHSRKRTAQLEQRLLNAKKSCYKECLKKATSIMNKPAKIFTTMQFRESRKSMRGRRYTADEKILALAFYNKSCQCYNLLRKCFALPSPRLLKKINSEVKKRGVDPKLIFEHLLQTNLLEEKNKDSQISKDVSERVLPVLLQIDSVEGSTDIQEELPVAKIVQCTTETEFSENDLSYLKDTNDSQYITYEEKDLPVFYEMDMSTEDQEDVSPILQGTVIANTSDDQDITLLEVDVSTTQLHENVLPLIYEIDPS